MSNKRIGIMTMHKVLNYGSALQAYALQHHISSTGNDAELIDYIFPNGKRKSAGSIKATIINSVANALVYFPKKRKKQRFAAFYDSYFNCSKEQFNSPEELMEFKPEYDVLITGSDQVWNPKHIKDDLSFFLPFAGKEMPKYSYGSSFSTATIPDTLSETFRKNLMRYNQISVREKSGLEIVKNLTGKEADFVCDPTLLLTKEEWSAMADKADNKFQFPKGKYILVYLLRYAYDPYPAVTDIINKIQEELQLPIVVLDPSLSESKFKNSTNVRDAGPLEFLKLVRDAAFVVTSSFHGTAFSLNLEVPFFSIIKERGRFDTRMTDLLDRAGADRDIVYNASVDKPFEMDYTTVSKNIADFRDKSKEFINSIMQTKQ